MRVLKKILGLLIIITITVSCNTEEKKAQENLQIQKVAQEKKFNKMKDLYSAVELTEDDLNSYYSFELESKFLGETVIGSGKILDILKININLYIIRLSVNQKFSQQYYCEIKTSKEQIDKLLKLRNQEIKKLETKYDKDAINHFSLNNLQSTLIFKPSQIKKGLYLYKTIEEYSIIGENVEDAELDDYTINMEIDSDTYIVYGDCIDLSISDIFIN